MVSRHAVFWDVDTQADFLLPGGGLYVPGAENLIPNLKRLVDAARAGNVFLVSDACFHAPDDPEFKQWPPHCVRGTPGQGKIPETVIPGFYSIPNDPAARVPEDLLAYPQVLLEKQTLDVFDNPHATTVVERLRRAFAPAAPEFCVFGVVTEYCVRLAAKGLLDRGQRVALVTDAIETLNPADGHRALDELCARGARLLTTEQALALL
jgi:nicotinamidase/pyrazinamidase